MPDNPNKPGVGPNKGDLQEGDIEWVVPPTYDESRQKTLSGPQRRDLAGRIKARLKRLNGAQGSDK